MMCLEHRIFPLSDFQANYWVFGFYLAAGTYFFPFYKIWLGFSSGLTENYSFRGFL